MCIGSTENATCTRREYENKDGADGAAGELTLTANVPVLSFEPLMAACA
jgi:hypothetical protein